MKEGKENNIHKIYNNKINNKTSKNWGELNQKFESRKREKWHQFGANMDSNFSSIQIEFR